MTRRKQRDLESQRAQQRSKRAVQLVTETASPPLDNLANESVLIDYYLASAGDVEILKRNRQQMGAMNRPQGFRSGSSRTAVGDAIKISFDVEHDYKRGNRNPVCRQCS